MSASRHLRRWATAIGLAAGLAVAMAPAAAAHPAADGADPLDGALAEREQYLAGVDVPLVSSPNVHLETTIPDVGAISGCSAHSAPFFYVSSLKSVTVYDVSHPKAPQLTGVLDNIVFENEAMNCGERTVDGKTTRFVLVGIDLTQTSTGDIEHIRPVGFDEFLVIDVTDPAKPVIRSRAQTSSSTHTVACADPAQCDYVYTAGGSVVDLTDLDNPREIKTVESPALDENPQFGGGAGHKWNFDGAGYGIHTGSGGTAMFDVTDPANPKLVTSTDANGVGEGWNDFIHHNADRPNGAAFVPGAAPSVENGNVLLVTEEDYENPDCATAGSFQTWHVRKLDGTADAITPLDRINPVDAGEGVALPNLAFCSAHWFDYHPSGIVAQGFYQGGLRLLDVTDPANITEFGYFASGLSEVWDAYWVPERDADGVATGGKSNVVYTADLIRGIDVFTVDLPVVETPPAVVAPGLGLDGVLGILGSVLVVAGIRRR